MDIDRIHRKRFAYVMMILTVLVILVFLFSMNLGSYPLSPLDTIKTLFGGGTSESSLVLFGFRMPRMVLALLIGAGLAVSGAILQGVSRNELADPGIIGINAGAGLAVVLFIYTFEGSMGDLGWFSLFAMPFSALAGAFLAAFLIYILAWKQGISPIRLILVGIAVNAGFNALLIVFQLRMEPNNFSQAMIWLSGSIWGANWRLVLSTLPWIAILLPYTIYKSKHLNVLALGDSIATGLGTKVEKERRVLLAAAVALAGACVAVGGGIAFLGLVAPHLARRLVGPMHHFLIPTSAVMGALLLLIADTIGKNLFTPAEIPVGLVVSAIGAPYFIYLLMKTN
ncbi:FecCD family ABC transporter permease [Salibacterium qingdaonense]|uniref:Iron complex transport system permease protein n=1 Tax=Salibacterium qingdaonense TaxID=266892 RepID=A0A1I4LBH6_9BACI|nr:iron ABC transporter permease [Salibacterium qingdaonense]SFL88362.1 iron complex transport system permease protein [Salibacterium qingdaonense]